MAAYGMLNLGQEARQRHRDDDVVLVGFAGHHGSVVAGAHWGAPMQRMNVPPARAGSHEDLLHRAGVGDSLFVFSDRATPWLSQRLGHRAIGVVYDPGGERAGNWGATVLGGRYDAFCSFDATEALHALPSKAQRAELETYPWTT
jgi:erythromycin esterase